jgi:subtilisin family serine protease
METKPLTSPSNPIRVPAPYPEITDRIDVLIQLKPRRGIRFSFGLGESLPAIPYIDWDRSFPPVHLPTLEPAVEKSFFSLLSPDPEIVVARGRVSRDALPQLVRAVKDSSEAMAVFSDPSIRPFPVCADSPSVGDAAGVAALLNNKEFAQRGMTGENVAIAVVDTGINLAYLRERVPPARFDAATSWSWKDGPTPGDAKVDHGTMCAFDALISAQKATLIDIAVLGQKGGRTQLLSNALQAYGYLLTEITRKKLLQRYAALVVTNSWGIYDPDDDVPSTSYTENPAHPFNIIVRSLVRAGADVVFAAGNCGEECPADWCNGKTTGSIYGANSHPDVISVAGVTVEKERVGYSSKGPGRLAEKKPDLCGYTHFEGSGVFSNDYGTVDSGTSAAAPVVAGFIAGIRSSKPVTDLPPADLKQQLLESADHLGRTDHDSGYGWGVVDGRRFISYIDR